MHQIEMAESSQEFEAMWLAAGRHLSAQIDGGIQSWIRAHLNPPFLEHLSFRHGNQLFFIHVFDVDQRVRSPGSLDGLQRIASSCQGFACLMPMRGGRDTGGWHPVHTGWGLVDMTSHQEVDPVALLTYESIEITDWELHDFAIQVVRDALESQGYEIMSWCPDPNISPSIWFVGDSKGPEWVVVRAARYPQRAASKPAGREKMVMNYRGHPSIGHFASVVIANSRDPFDPTASTNGNFLPIFRGQGAVINFKGLEALT